ncbi:MAG: hypothetical protein J6Y02_24250 [Pseudobutyrivibrio sp.]|nr:hypothetical protein [Pseudobutyrivibrio sp.]
MAINVNEDGVLKPLNIETAGWTIKGLDWIGEIVYGVPGKTNTTVTASSSNPVATKYENLTSYTWCIIDLDRQLGEYKYIIFIPEAEANNNYGGYMRPNANIMPCIQIFNPSEMWRAREFMTTYKDSIGCPISSMHNTYPWSICPAGIRYPINELNDTKLYIRNTNIYSNQYLTVLGLR